MVNEEIVSFYRQFFILSTFLCCGFNAGVMLAWHTLACWMSIYCLRTALKVLPLHETRFRGLCFILSTFLCCAYNGGVMLAYPGVLNDHLLSPNSTEGVTATADEVSWIASSTGISGAIGNVLLPIIMDGFGRKSVNFVLNSFLLIGWLFILFAKNVTSLVIGRALQGIKIGGVIIAIITVGEYVHPARRGYFNILKLVSMSLGIITCHVLSMFCTWRHIAVFSLIPSIYAVVSVFFWPESPPYLAMKGKFAECERSYVWLNGKSSWNNKELSDLIEVQRVKQGNKDKMKSKSKVKNFLKSLITKDLIKPVVIVVILAVLQETSGKNFFSVYIVQIMREFVGKLSYAVYCSLAVDLMTLLATLICVFLVKSLSRRVLLFTSGGISVVLMAVISLLVILKSGYFYSILKSVPYLTPVIIIIYCFIINVGVIPLAFTLTGEVFPLEFRALGSCVSGFSKSVVYSFTLKYIPLLISSASTGIAYAIFAVISLLCLISLYFLLPETKDRTLQDIEFDITGEKYAFVESKPILSDDKLPMVI